jgi:hypothetical protein
MGINKDLKLKGNDFTNAATAFFIAYLVAEVPNGEFPIKSAETPESFRPSILFLTTLLSHGPAKVSRR